MATRRGKLHIGTSGYQYDHWRGVLYPEGVAKKRWFQHYAQHFETVEINNTFYHLPSAETFEHWRDQTPKGFVYALKYSRYGTHIKRLKDPAQHVDVFLERADTLGAALGPILVQLPPKWHVDADRLEAFLHAAPADYRWAIELRDASWLCEDVYELLRAHGAALCLHDLIARHPRIYTTDWTYLRFHGDDDGGNYSPQALAGAAKRIARLLDSGMDVYTYFNNDAKGYAVRNAQALRQYVARQTAAV